MKLVFVLILLDLAVGIFLYRAYHRLPLAELRRRARTGRTNDKRLFKATALGSTLDVFLWAICTAEITFLLIAAARWGWWLAALLIIVLGWIMFFAPKPKDSGWAWTLAAYMSPVVFKMVNFCQPVLDPLTKFLPAGAGDVHTGLYDKEDLLDLLNVQNHQVDSRVPEDELKMAFGALTFGDKKVAEVMTPRKKIHFVLADEIVGPTLMDELHKTKQTRFPVVKQIKKNIEPEIIGTLLLSDITGLDKEGPVSGAMRKGVYYINEEDDLHTCLDAFTKTKAHLLIVVNNFEEIAGAVGLEDVLGEIIGKPPAIDFNDYHNKEAVAGRGQTKN